MIFLKGSQSPFCFTRGQMAPVVGPTDVPVSPCLRVRRAHAAYFLWFWVTKRIVFALLAGLEETGSMKVAVYIFACLWEPTLSQRLYSMDIYVFYIPKMVSPYESPLCILVQALSHTNAAAWLCLYTQPAKTVYFFFPCLHESTRYVLSDLSWGLPRKVTAWGMADFFISAVRRKQLPKPSRHDLHSTKCYVCEILQSLYLHLCWERNAVQGGVFVNSTETSLWITAAC